MDKSLRGPARPGLLLTLSTVAILLAGGCSHSPGASEAGASDVPTVAVAKVKRADLSRDLVLAAEFRPFQEVDVHAKVAGYVKDIYVDVGDHVRDGQLLAVLEIPELRDEVVQAEAAVRKSEEDIKQAAGELERSESAHEVAHLAYSRLAAVIKTQPDLVAQQDIDDAQGRDRVTEAQVSAAKAGLAAAKQQLEVAKANQEKVKSLFAYARITAPFAAVVTKRYADTGSMIQAGTSSQTQTMPVVRLSQNDLLRLVVPVPESVVPEIHLGSGVEVRVPAFNKTFEGKVARFADRVDEATRTMHTEVDVPNPQLELVPGMYAYASIILDRKHDVLAVPVEALNRAENRVTVFRVDATHKIEERAVQIGIETPNTVEVVSGLAENDLVVVGSRSQIRPGEAVQPKIMEHAEAAGGGP